MSPTKIVHADKKTQRASIIELRKSRAAIIRLEKQTLTSHAKALKQLRKVIENLNKKSKATTGAKKDRLIKRIGRTKDISADIKRITAVQKQQLDRILVAFNREITKLTNKNGG